MCDCYRIDHPGADPDCATHGVLAVGKREKTDALIARLEALVLAGNSERAETADRLERRIYQLEEFVANQAQALRQVAEMVSQNGLPSP